MLATDSRKSQQFQISNSAIRISRKNDYRKLDDYQNRSDDNWNGEFMQKSRTASFLQPMPITSTASDLASPLSIPP